MSTYWESEFEALMMRLLDGPPGMPDAAKLEQLLTAHPEAMDVYLQLMTLDTHAREFVRSKSHVAGELASAIGSGGGTQSSGTNGKAVAAPSDKGAKPVQSPVLGFLGGALEYVHHSRTMMFSLIALALSGWFIVQLGSLMFGRSRPGGAPVASQPGNPNSPDVSHPPGGSFAHSASPRQRDSMAFMTALVDCHWRVVPPAAPAASAPAPGDADTRVDANRAGTNPMDPDKLFHVGSELPAGEQLDLVRGMAEITFRSGASIVLNGPAHFTVGSVLGGTLHLGKLTARVPHDAHGFTIHSPAGEVVDLGTEFGMAVAADHTMAVEVFVGEVAVDSSADGEVPGPSEKVTAGHAVRVAPGQPVVSIPLDPKRFVRGLGPREDSRVAHAAYLDWMRSLQPAVWFRMEGHDADRVLHDEMGAAPDGVLTWDGPGNAFVEGRLGKSLWLRGTKLKDGAIVPSYPQAEHGKLTVSAWVFANSYPRNFSSPAVCNWADANRGQFYFGLKGDRGGKSASLIVYITLGNGKVVWLAEPASHPFPLYEWQHVAFTTDGTTLRLYRQGREVTSMKHAGLQYPVHLQSLGIGERLNDAGSGASPKHSDNWDGKLDEIAIFNDVLPADDIRKLADAPP